MEEIKKGMGTKGVKEELASLSGQNRQRDRESQNQGRSHRVRPSAKRGVLMVERSLMMLVGGKLLPVQGADDGQKNEGETPEKEQTGGESKTAPKHAVFYPSKKRMSRKSCTFRLSY
jgi:hypothetical protein